MFVLGIFPGTFEIKVEPTGQLWNAGIWAERNPDKINRREYCTGGTPF